MRVTGLTMVAGASLLAALVAACGDTLGPDERFLSTIEVDFNPLSIGTPLAVPVGTSFEVQIVSYHTLSCEEQAFTDVKKEGMTITIRPYDKDTGRVCQDRSEIGFRAPKVRFDQRGVGKIVVQGFSTIANDTISVVRDVGVF